MRVFLSTLVYDLDGRVAIDTNPSSNYGEHVRRVSRTATLDGGAVPYDGGHSEGDRTITLQWRPGSPEAETSIERLVKLYATLRYFDNTGAYLVIPERYAAAPAQSTLSLLVLSKESQE